MSSFPCRKPNKPPVCDVLHGTHFNDQTSGRTWCQHLWGSYCRRPLQTRIFVAMWDHMLWAKKYDEPYIYIWFRLFNHIYIYQICIHIYIYIYYDLEVAVLFFCQLYLVVLSSTQHAPTTAPTDSWRIFQRILPGGAPVRNC